MISQIEDSELTRMLACLLWFNVYRHDFFQCDMVDRTEAGDRVTTLLLFQKIPQVLYSAPLHRQIGTLPGLYYAVGLHSRRVVNQRYSLRLRNQFP